MLLSQGLALALWLLAAPAEAQADKTANRPRLIVLALTPAGGVDPGLAESLTESVAADVARTGLFQVTSQKDVTTMLGVERQKQLLGCSETSQSCMAELADALGARFVLSGSVTQLGDVYQLNLQTLDSVKATTLGRSTRIAGDLKALRDLAPYAISEATATPAPEPPSRALPITMIAGGGVLLAGAGVAFFQSVTREEAAANELKLAELQPQLQLKPAQYYRDEARAVVALRAVGTVGALVGAGLVATGILLFPRQSGGRVGVALVPTGPGAAVVGVFP